MMSPPDLDALAEAARDPDRRPALAAHVDGAAQCALAALQPLCAAHDAAQAAASPDGLSWDPEAAPVRLAADPERVQLATSALRALRNLCAACPAAQAAAEPGLFADLVPRFCGAYVPGDDEEDAALALCVRVALQALANWCTAHEGNQARLWAAWAPDGLLRLLYAVRADRRALAVAARLVFHCVVDSEERARALAGMGGAVCVLLQAALPAPGREEQDDDPCFEPVQLLFARLVRADLLPELFAATASRSVRLDAADLADAVVTAERLLLLRVLSTVEPPLPTATLVFLARRLKQLRAGPAPAPPADFGAADSDAERAVMWETFREEAVTLVLDVLSEALARVPEGDAEGQREAVCAAELPQTLLALLRDAFPDMTAVPPVPAGPPGRGGAAMAALGHAVFRCRAAQDAVRLAEGLPAVLYCCQFDPGSPMLREWGVLAVRHLCEGNEENQAAIAELQPQELAPGTTEQLGRMGLSARLSGGRVVVGRTAGGPGTAAGAGGMPEPESAEDRARFAVEALGLGSELPPPAGGGEAKEEEEEEAM